MRVDFIVPTISSTMTDGEATRQWERWTAYKSCHHWSVPKPGSSIAKLSCRTETLRKQCRFNMDLPVSPRSW